MDQILRAIKIQNKDMIASLKEGLKEAHKTRDRLRGLRTTKQLTFTVTLTSVWPGDAHHKAEQDVTRTKVGSLPDLIKEAEEEFKRVNNRGDLQVDYAVSVAFGKDSMSSLPLAVFEHLTEKKRKP